ncbi:MAG TPA: hypothetical protein VGA37_14010 [Gemmatimonadales bacterium]
MTQTGAWLVARRAGLLVRRSLADGLVTLGLLAAVCALGIVLDRAGLYRTVPELALTGWVVMVGILAAGTIRGWRHAGAVSAARIAADMESRGGLRRGSVSGLAGVATAGSRSLALLADRRMREWLDRHGDAILDGARQEHRRAVGRSAILATVGLAAVVVVLPGSRSGTFWHPLRDMARARGPVGIEVSARTVRYGDSVTVQVVAEGRRSATLFVRAPGEPWEPTRLPLDSVGRARVVLGPLESDRFLHATSGGRLSDTVTIHVAVPAFVSDLALLARYPRYLERADEPLASGPEPLALPMGTAIVTRGRLTVDVDSAVWWRGDLAVALEVEGNGFSGMLPVTRSGRWTLRVGARNGAPTEGDPVELMLIAVPDSAPILAVPIPGADTTVPTTLRQPVVIDVRDDHRVVAVEVVSRRVSRLGIAGEPLVERVPLPAGGVEGAVLQWSLDLTQRGFLPGDTAYFRVRAADNAPDRHVTESREFALRLPSMADLRAAARRDARQLAQAADSLAQRQQDLSRSAEDLASERERGDPNGAGAQPGDEQLGFRTAERAQEIAGEQADLLNRAAELRDQVRHLSEAAWQAGLTDPAWHQQLADLQALLERAITPEIAEALEALRNAMQQLDAGALRDALQRLAEAQEQLRNELERGRTLFERAALEGEMSTMADDADELAHRQQEWNQAAAQQADSAMAAREERLAAEADSLAARLEQLEHHMEQQAGSEGQTADQAAAQQASAAAQQMRQAARQAQQANESGAADQGNQASSNLDPIADQLRQQRDALRDEWRREVLESMDHALVETAQLARQQDAIQRRLGRGESRADLRSAQAAVRDGVDRVMERLQGAAGQNALVSPQLGTALGYAKQKMTQALDQIQQANPNTRGASSDAADAVDGLNALAYQLLRSRSDVSSSASGSGMQEAIQRMSELAQQQNAMTGQSSGMLPLMPQGGEALMQQLRALAEQQRALGEELDRMRAEGDQSGAGELAEEARELARALESGLLDREMIERQEQLYRRLLDAGRSLRGNEEDDRKERESVAGQLDNTLRPDGTRVPEAGPRFAYPSWDALQRLSPDERRLILDYFRRLNEVRRDP